MPEEFAFWARQSTAKGSKPKEVCWYMCRAVRQWEAERATGEERSGSRASLEPSQGMHLPSSKAAPLALLSQVKTFCFIICEVWPVCLQLQSCRKYPPDSTDSVFTGFFLYLCSCFYSSSVFVCTEKQLDCTNSKKKFNEYLNSKANFGGICVAML